MKYAISNGFRVTGDAQTLGDELDGVRKDHGGELQPQHVVDAARPANNPLHSNFEWNNKRAAVRYRLDQARYLIRAVVLCPNDDGPQFSPVRAFVPVQAGYGSETDLGAKTSYIRIQDAKDDPTVWESVIRRAKAELAAWYQRNRDYAEFAKVHRAIEHVLYS